MAGGGTWTGGPIWRLMGWRKEGNTRRVSKKAKKWKPRKEAARPDSGHLDELIAEATVDCCNESEEVTGIFTLLEENLEVPFTTTLLGVEVTVKVIDLPLPEPKPKGTESIDAYRRWARWK
jgi:hypothetical protein